MQCSLLIVDDNPRWAKMLAECFLKDGGFKVDVCTNGAEALHFLKDNDPNIVLVDMLMPGMDGAELIVQCRKCDVAKNTKFIALSPLASEEVIKLTQSLGMSYFIALPTSPEKIYDTVVRLLGILGSAGNGKRGRKRGAADDKMLDEIIMNYLHVISIQPHVSGYKYLKESIEYCVENYGRKLSVTKDVYPAVAEKCNSTPKRVERNIRTAIETAWIRGDIEMQYKLFGYTVNDNKGRPTNKECIAMLTDRTMLRLRYR